ncbi:MAG: PorT family protein [Bacteroidales bacterium]|nr:PorT family protein [Bacteroidales bacterium]
MKRSFLFYYSIIFLLITIGLNAQDGPLPSGDLINPRLNLPPRVSIGIKIGANIFSPLITHDPSAVYNTTPTGEFVPGFNAGIGAIVAMSGKISLFADVQFVSSSAKYLIESGNYLDEFKEDLNQLSIPIGVLYQLGAGGVKYYPMAGLVLNYLMYSDLSYLYHPYPTESAYTRNGGFDITFDRNRIHFDALAGFGFQYQVKGFFLGLELSYRYGLRNYIDTNDMQPMQIYSGSSIPFKYQSPGFRTHGIMVNLMIQKPGT